MALAIVRDICTVYMIEAESCTECEEEFEVPQCMDVCMEDECIVTA